MTHDYSKPLTVVLSGTGNTTIANLSANLEDFMFGPVNERDIKIIVPIFSKMGAGMRTFFKWGNAMGFDFKIVQTEGASMTPEISALPSEAFTRMPTEQDTLDTVIEILADSNRKGHETAFIMLFNPESTSEFSDMHMLSTAKQNDWLVTLNLCEGLVDSFEGFETEADRAHRESVQQKFDEEERAAEDAERAAVKAQPKPSTGHRRASSKPKVSEPKPLAEDPEKPLQDVPIAVTTSEATNSDVIVGIDKLVGKAVAREEAKRATSPTISLSFSSSKSCDHRYIWVDDEIGHSGSFCERCGIAEGYEPSPTELSATATITSTPTVSEVEEVWTDVVRAAPKVQSVEHITVPRADLAELADSIKNMTDSFGRVMDAFARILKNS